MAITSKKNSAQPFRRGFSLVISQVFRNERTLQCCRILFFYSFLEKPDFSHIQVDAGTD